MLDESLRPSSEAEAILRKVGWFPEREVDISAWIEWLHGEDVKVFPLAAAILKCFGGVHLKNKRLGRPPIHSFDIDPIHGEEDRIHAIEKILGRMVCPVGETFGSSCLAVVEDGGVITDFDGDVCLIGNNWRAALDRLIFGKDWDRNIQIAEDYRLLDRR